MSHSDFQLAMLETALQHLSERVADVPVTGILLIRLLTHLGRGMASLLDEQIRPFGLTEAEFRVLTTLFAQPDGAAYPSDVCARTDQSPANMSRLTDALADRHLITRVLSERDRRRIVLRVTAQGEELVRRLLPTLFAPVHSMFKDFTASEQQQLVMQLKRVSAELEQAMLQAGGSCPSRAEST